MAPVPDMHPFEKTIHRVEPVSQICIQFETKVMSTCTKELMEVGLCWAQGRCGWLVEQLMVLARARLEHLHAVEVPVHPLHEVDFPEGALPNRCHWPVERALLRGPPTCHLV